MKNKKRNIIIIGIILIIGIITGIIIFTFAKDETRLTTEEKQWITTNTSTVQSISVMNNVDILGKNGKGVFYDFIEDLKKEYNLTINPITYNVGEETSTRSFTIKSTKDSNDLVFYEGHYVLLAKQFTNIEGLSDLKNINIGVLKNDEARIQEYSKKTLELKSFENIENLLEGFKSGEELGFIILPQQQYLDTILTNSFEIVYHFSDLKNYYVYEVPEEKDLFSNIIAKFFIKWKEEKLAESISKNTLNSFMESLNISQKEISSMQAEVFGYGFMNNSPYEVIMGGNYGGIISEYLRSFSEMSNIEFEFRKYNSVSDFNKAIANKDINIYFNYYNFDNDFESLTTTINLEFEIIAPSNSNQVVISSLQSLKDQTIYVLANSKLQSYLESVEGIKIQTYDNEKELKKIAKKEVLIAIDSRNFQYYNTNILKDYTSRYNEVTNINYNFKINGDSSFVTLFTKYINTLDSNQIITAGLYNHEVTISKGSTLGNVAKYFLLACLALLFLTIVMYRSSKRVKLATKIKRENKIRYIDQLTSLKNRNYLSENINNWNKNTIYPQTAIIVDLNNLQEINDTLGYEHGDNQIKAAANILIKTQLDNSDIIRTDGNEFLIYLVGYPERQIVSYIRKLYKEFKNMPYEHGAAIGYSMITDNLKTLEDAINEAVEDMRLKKEEIIED